MPRPALAGLLLALACASPRPAPPVQAAARSAPAEESPTSPAAPPAFAPVPPVGPDEWWNGAVFYEVFVRSFADSGDDGSGDLRGLTAHLDHLNDGNPDTHDDLGVDALYLMPVFESPSSHGYDVIDYERVNREYGTEADLAALLQAAHRRGMKVILDLPLNHTSERHPWFRDSASGPGSPRRDWYEWSPKDPGWGQPWDLNTRAWHRSGTGWYYGLFSAGMPDLNYRNPEVREEMKRIVRLWLERGVDGFRLDAVRFLVETGPMRGQVSTPETHAYLKELAASARSVNPQAPLVGEVWSITEDIADYYGDGRNELRLAFDFPLAAAIVSAARNGRTEELASVLAAVKKSYPPGAVDAPFLTNHDQRRVATEVGSDPARLRLAAALLLTLPGSPFIYQGEELGQENGPGQADEEKRTPMCWECQGAGHGFSEISPWRAFAPGADRRCVSAERADPGSLLSWYRTLIAVRKSTPALARGDLQLVKVPGAPRTAIAFLRRNGTEAVLVVHNAGAEAADTGLLEVAGTSAEPLLPGPARLERSEGGWRATLPPLSSGAWRLR
jgi:alpha-amylase